MHIGKGNSQNIVISGLTLKNGASWNVHMVYSDNIVTKGCSFHSQGIWNGDGWDPDSSTNCAIFDCVFHTGDDSISIKSGKNPEGNQINKPCEHIRVFDCQCAAGNGITIGSEMSGGIRDVRIWDCDMSRSFGGFEIKGTKKRGGFVQDVQIFDCVFPRIRFHAVGYNDDGIAAQTPPVFKDCTFDRVRILGEYRDHDGRFLPCESLIVNGFDEPGYEIKNILFKDITIGKEDSNNRQTLLLRLCDEISFQGLRCL